MPNPWLVTNDNRLAAARRALDEAANSSSGHRVYLWVGSHQPRQTIPDSFDAFMTVDASAARDMVSGKRVTSLDALLVVNSVPWQSGTHYPPYDDRQDLTSATFYATINAGAFYHTWKVMDDGQGANSTVSPNFADLDGTNDSYRTSDGYLWKYLYSVDSANVARFATSSWFPVVANATVQGLASPGAIENLLVDDPGAGYGNYLTGTFASADLRVGGNTILYGVGSNGSASVIDQYYVGTVMYLAAGTGAGQFKSVVNYFINSTSSYVVLDSAFSTAPTNGTQFEMWPEVAVAAAGKSVVVPRARAIVNSSGNTIARVEVLDHGSGVEYATASVNAHTSVGISAAASVHPCVPPPGGHGSDPARELMAHAVSYAVSLSNTEGNTLPLGKFHQIGLLRDPLHANVVVVFSSVNGAFTTGEAAYRINRARLFTQAGVSQVGNTTLAGGSYFSNQFSAGDWVYLVNAANTARQLTTVASVANSSQLTMSQAALFADSNAQVLIANATLVGDVVNQVNSTAWQFSRVGVDVSTNDSIVGANSGGLGACASVVRGGVSKTFSAFCAAMRVTGANTGAFVEDESVYQGASLASATFAGELVWSNTNNIYLSNTVGTINLSSVVVGANSGASLAPTAKYDPEIEFESGQVVFVQSVDETERAPTETEQFTLVIKY